MAVARVSSAILAAACLALAGCGAAGTATSSTSAASQPIPSGAVPIPTAGMTVVDHPHTPVPLPRGRDVRGGPVSLRPGAVTVINIWASTCGPCQEETADLVRLSQDPALGRVQFVGVSRDPQNSDAAAFVRAHHVPYPSLLDPDGTYQHGLARVAPPFVPVTLVLDTHGRLAARVLGAVHPAALRPVLLSLLP